MDDLITCRKMTAADARESFEMLSSFLTADEHYLASSQAYGDRGMRGLNDGLYLFLERPVHVIVGNDVGREGRLCAIAAERMPRVAIGLAGRWQMPRRLQRRERARKIDARFAVDLAA